MPLGIHTELGTIRRRRGVSAADLAKRVGVSRQTIHAIEAGSYVPNTEVALKLARELEVPVEELFALEQTPSAPSSVAADLLSPTPLDEGHPVRLCEINGRMVSVPASASPYFLQDGDGILAGDGIAAQWIAPPDDASQRRILLAGCDPALGLLAAALQRSGDADLVIAPGSSHLALRWLKEGKVHIAGSHLRDAETGEYNLGYLRREFPDEDFAVFVFAAWEEGFVTAPGNPRGIRRVEDLVREGVRFINREIGSGSRALFDRLMSDSGVPSSRVPGYDTLARGHLEAAYAVQSGRADCCVAVRSAAQTFGLGFVPLQTERFDLVMRRESLASTAVRNLMNALSRAGLRRRLELIAGYDTRQTGAQLI